MIRNPARLLILEDEEMLARMTAKLLRREGYLVSYECDGNAGLEEASSSLFDLCLLNVLLPGLDGYSIALQLKERGIELPLIFFTAISQEEVAKKTADLGLRVAYVPKPYSIKVLLRTVAHVLDGKGWL